MSLGSHRIRVPSLGVDLSADAEETLLDSLAAAGVDYPSGCTSGICGLCKSRLVSGEVALADYCPALNEAEREAGLTLPCSARPLSDCVLSPVDDGLLPPVATMTAEVVALDSLTHDIRRVVLRPEGGRRLAFLPGQYASLGFGDWPTRDFSMASCPEEPDLTFYVRRVPGGEVTDFVCERLRCGDTVRFKGPYGVAYLREGHIGPMIAVAGGSGLAPVRSIVESALRRGMAQPIRLYFGVRGPQDLYEAEALAALARRHPTLQVETLFSEEDAPGVRRGRLDAVLAADLAGTDLSAWRAYVAGPPVMVEAVAARLAVLGLPDDACHSDPFLTARERAQPARGETLGETLQAEAST